MKRSKGMHLLGPSVLGALGLLVLSGCGRSAIVESDLPVKRVVLYRNGVAYFERQGHVEDEEVRFKMKETEVGDFLATLAVMEQGGSSVRAAAFPIDVPNEDEDEEDKTPRWKMTEDEKRGLKTVVLSLDGNEHDLKVGYVAESPVWRPSYRLVVGKGAQAELQAWGIIQNLSGEDWHDVELSLVAGAPLAFEAQLGEPVIPPRPVVTDQGEVIAAVPQAETSLRQEREAKKKGEAEKRTLTSSDLKDKSEAYDGDDGIAGSDEEAEEQDAAAEAAGGEGGGLRATTRAGGGSKADRAKLAKQRRHRPMAPPAPAASPARDSAPAGQNAQAISQPRNLRSLAAVAIEGGNTRYDIPVRVNVPDKSATMVLLLSRRVKGEALFLFAPDGGVPESSSHPFRVARFTNQTGGILERGPIAVFEKGAFLGQGMVDPLPPGAATTVPFALERGLAIDRMTKYDEQGARVKKIESGKLTIERDGATRTIYRVRNGSDENAKVMVKHPRQSDTHLHAPPKGTEDLVGKGHALVPLGVAAHATTELVVDERRDLKRYSDWFSDEASDALKNFFKESTVDKGVQAKLKALWPIRESIIKSQDERNKLEQEKRSLQEQTSETRRNLIAIEKNKTAAALRNQLTARLANMATRLDEITKRIVEIDSKNAEQRVRFREGIRELKYERPDAPTGR